MKSFLLSSPLISAKTSDLSSRINRVDVNNSIEDEFRDDKCVVNENTENRKGGENNTSLPMNAINI